MERKLAAAIKWEVVRACQTGRAGQGWGMLNYLLVALGGALGSVARYGASGLAIRWLGDGFPWGTLLVNVTGSFAIGLLSTLTADDGRWAVSPGGRAFFMAGVCGGFTTFSAFSLQTLELMRDDRWVNAGLNVVGSVVLCLVAVWLGHLVARALGG
jgi:CrcB protein